MLPVIIISWMVHVIPEQSWGSETSTWVSWVDGWFFCQCNFSGSAKDMNFRLCMQIALWWKVDVHLFLIFGIFLKKYKKINLFISVIFHDLQMAQISNFACKEHTMGGQSTCLFLYFFVFFSHKYAKFSFTMDTSCHTLPTYYMATVLRTQWQVVAWFVDALLPESFQSGSNETS